MRLIPGGTFLMGDAMADDPMSQPVHGVRLSPFCMDETEVTVAAYAACVDARACPAPATTPDCTWNVAGHDQHPVNASIGASRGRIASGEAETFPPRLNGSSARGAPTDEPTRGATKCQARGSVGATQSRRHAPARSARSRWATRLSLCPTWQATSRSGLWIARVPIRGTRACLFSIRPVQGPAGARIACTVAARGAAPRR
nr:SUMF1/EgtB/PvdO family nonheme iron enzyme [Deltaproteobacteria bacterium]